MNPPEDFSLSCTFCSSLDPCSSHGFSSLQSPSAFPSFFSNDSSQQIDAFQPLSLDSAELSHCHLWHRCREAELDIAQNGTVSHNNLNFSPSEEGHLLHHTGSQKLVCPLHGLQNKARNQSEGLQKESDLDYISKGSPRQERASAEQSISLPSFPSSLGDDTEFSAFSHVQYGYQEKDNLAPNKLDHQFPSSPDPKEHGFHSHHEFETCSRIIDTACIDAHTTHSCHKSSCIMPPEVLSSVLTPPSHSLPALIARHGDADNKENLMEAHINSSRERGVQLLNNPIPPCAVKSKPDCKSQSKNEALQEVHENKKTMYSSCKEMLIVRSAVDAVVDETSKENVSPYGFEQTYKTVSGLKADCNGWMCPKDAKKKFKPKPRQLLLDKWLTRQR